METISTIGRRKAAIARIYMNEGKGQIIVNNRDYKEYFPDKQLHYVVEQPLNLLEVKGNYDIKVNLDGGGMTGQAEALRLAIARALIKVNPEYKDSSSKINDKYLKIVSESMSGSTKEECDKNYKKIIKNIAKETIIDKNIS